MSNFKKLKGFTLAEIMIVLTIIGILTGILMPIAINSAPDKNVMKFKKAHNTMIIAIRELVNSDKYYLDGYLDTKPDGSLVGDEAYLCETLADVINHKKKECVVKFSPEFGSGQVAYDESISLDEIKTHFDAHCTFLGPEEYLNTYIKTDDDVVFYDLNPTIPFGRWADDISTTMYRRTAVINGLEKYVLYKSFCFDIDEVGGGESPFGYGVTVDGKVITSAKVDEWLEKSVQRGD